MNLDRATYTTICRNLAIPAYEDDVGEHLDERLYDAAELLVKVTERVRKLEKSNEST